MSKCVARCKFRVDAVTLRGKTFQEIRLVTEYDDSVPEDVKFALATPSGELKFNLTNPNLMKTFQPGQTYYVDLILVDGS